MHYISLVRFKHIASLGLHFFLVHRNGRSMEWLIKGKIILGIFSIQFSIKETALKIAVSAKTLLLVTV